MMLSYRVIRTFFLVTVAAPASGIAKVEADSPAPTSELRCEQPLHPTGPLPRNPGESLEYSIDSYKLSLGKLNLHVRQRTMLEGEPATEYRGKFSGSSAIGALFGIEGQAAVMVPDEGFWPLFAKSMYRKGRHTFEETQTYSSSGKQVHSVRKKNGKAYERDSEFHAPVHDILSAFYMLRRLPNNAHGCVMVYGDQKTHTVWVTPEGHDAVETVLGNQRAARYRLDIKTEGEKNTKTARLWIGDDANRLPLKAEGLLGSRATMHLRGYQQGPPLHSSGKRPNPGE